MSFKNEGQLRRTLIASGLKPAWVDNATIENNDVIVAYKRDNEISRLSFRFGDKAAATAGCALVQRMIAQIKDPDAVAQEQKKELRSFIAC